jgi:chromosome segregation ATPase
MSDERLDRIETKVDGLVHHAGEVDRRLDGVDRRLDSIDAHLDRVDGRLDRVDGRLDNVERGLDALGNEMRTLNQDTRHEMRVLHEQVLDRIAALAPDFGPIRREFRKADQALRKSIERRLEPLEAAERARHRKN